MRQDIRVGDIITVQGSVKQRAITKTGCGSSGNLYKLDGLGNDCYPEGMLTKVADGVKRSIRRPVVVRQFGAVTVKSDRLSPTHNTGWLDDITLGWFQTHEFRLNVEYEAERKDDVFAALSDPFPALEVLDGGFTPASPGRQFWEGTVYLYATKGSELPVSLCNETLLAMVKDNTSALNGDKTAVRLINRIDAVLDLLGHGFKLGINIPEKVTDDKQV